MSLETKSSSRDTITVANGCSSRKPSKSITRDLAGNAIDFFVQILQMSFHDAMRQIIGP
jgi:hypothetical protein